jgi:hypothetical protein
MREIAILHEIPGRIRVCYPELSMNKRIQKQIEHNLSQTSGVNFIRVEPVISTVTVKYDTTVTRFENVFAVLNSFRYYTKNGNIEEKYSVSIQSFNRAVQRSAISGLLLGGSYLMKALNSPNTQLDLIATVFTGYTVLSHGDRNHDRIHHPDILTAFITSFALGPGKMTEAALTSWIMNVLELTQDYRRIKDRNEILTRETV